MKGSDRGQFGPDDAGEPGGGGSLDAYLDGQLSGGELSAFEARLARDPALARARDAQRRIDGGLRGLFVVPPFIPLPLNGQPPGGPNGHPTNGHPANGHPVSPATPAGTGAAAGHGWAGVKSAILTAKGLLAGLTLVAALLGAGGWLAYLHFTADRQLTFAEVYQRMVHAAPGGTVDRSQVESVASDTVGYAIRMKEQPANLKLVSMSQAHVLSPRTFVLQARVDGQDMLLLADRACEDAPLAGRGCGMHQFRREVGGVVFYELSPFDEPMLLNSYEVFPPGAPPAIKSTTRNAATKPAKPKH
jgi:hypothetical protein